MAQVTKLQTKQLIISIGLSLTIGVIICDGLDFNSKHTTKRRIFVVLKIVPILALVMAENAKIMEDFTKLKQHYVKCPRAVNMLKVIVGSVLLMEEGKNASMPVAQKMLKNGVTVKIMEDGKNASMLVAQKVLEVWGSVMLMEEGQNASMPVAQKVLKKGVTVLNME